ncbi:MAG: MATE family efflux transporter [Kofleriaceae bacterium]|nr:MATE family efflux transporter [Kofleriaceae bacterium]
MSSELRQQVTLAIPLAAQQLGVQLMGSVDAAWLGRYDDTALAAAGVGNNLLFAISAIGLGVVMGLDSVIPQAIGGGRHDDARRYLHAGLRLAVLVGLAGMLVVLATPLLLDLADAPPEIIVDARLYVYLRSLGIVPYLLSIALRSYLAANNITRPLLVAVIAGNLVNVLLDWALIFGVEPLGIPALGVAGAAIATLVVQTLITVVYAAAVRAIDGAHGRVQKVRSTRADIAKVARYGGPVGGQLFAEVGIFGVATVLAAKLGTLPAASHTIALNISSFTFSMAVGIGAATSLRVGLAVGEGNLALARRRGILGLATGLCTMSCFALLFLLAPGPLARLFTDESAVIGAAGPLLAIAALFQLSDGAQAVAAGALRGLGDTRATLVGNLIGHYAIGLPISLGLAFGAALGARGLWWGLSAGLTVTALYLVARFLAGTRTILKTPAETPR